MIEKKILIFGLFVLLLLPASALAADGDSSPESTIVFSETLPDDIMFYPDNETHGTGYAESFADVSDWGIGTGNTITTDGDVATFTTEGDGAWNIYYENSPAESWQGRYIEIRVSTNQTSGDSFGIVTKTEDSYGGSTIQAEYVTFTTTAYQTRKFYISSSTVVQCVAFITRCTTAPIAHYVDYLRIGNSTSMGWQHDGSTTAGVTNTGQGEIDFTTSSDGDILTLQAVRTSGSGTLYVYFKIAYDTTAISIDLERDYYPFFEFTVNATLQGGLTYVAPTYRLDGKYLSGPPDIIEDGTFHTYRVNTLSFTANTAEKYFGFYANIDDVNEGFIIEMDYVKLFSIANFTLVHSGITNDDVLYVDDGVLYSNIDSGYIELDHDPTLSVVPDTYPLYYNLITIGTAPEFSMYVSSWSTYSDETRGIVSSRIVTDIKLKFDSTEIISEIMFAMDDISIFNELFLSLDMWGYLGPMAMIVIGYVLAKKEKFLGVLWFVVECLFVTQYLALVEAMPNYWWHIFILLLGGLSTCVYPLLDR